MQNFDIKLFDYHLMIFKPYSYDDTFGVDSYAKTNYTPINFDHKRGKSHENLSRDIYHSISNKKLKNEIHSSNCKSSLNTLKDRTKQFYNIPNKPVKLESQQALNSFKKAFKSNESCNQF